MMSRTDNRFLVFLLGIWIALAPALNVSLATAMTIEQGIASDTPACSGECCSGEEMERGACLSFCFNTAQPAIAGNSNTVRPVERLRHEPPLVNTLLMLCAPPEPAPPKPSLPA